MKRKTEVVSGSLVGNHHAFQAKGCGFDPIAHVQFTFGYQTLVVKKNIARRIYRRRLNPSRIREVPNPQFCQRVGLSIFKSRVNLFLIGKHIPLSTASSFNI